MICKLCKRQPMHHHIAEADIRHVTTPSRQYDSVDSPQRYNSTCKILGSEVVARGKGARHLRSRSKYAAFSIHGGQRHLPDL